MKNLITTTQFHQMLGVGRSTLYRYRDKHDYFPAPIKFSKRTIRWCPDSVEKYIERKAQATSH